MSWWLHSAGAVVIVQLLMCLTCLGFQKSKEWDTLLHVQQWPPGIRVETEKSHHHFKITKNVTTWVIHGLWPTEHGTEGPNNCDPSWHFNFDRIANLTTQLDAKWPNLYGGTKHDEFWAHEWDKHGTCATSLSATANEYLYFKKALDLANRFDMLRYLGEAGIVPNENRKYKLSVVYNAISKVFNNKNFVLVCVSDKDKNDYLYTVELCLDKTFTPIDCVDPKHLQLLGKNPFTRDCSGEDILYPPISYTV